MLRLVQRTEDFGQFPRPEGMPEPLHRLLAGRGIRSAEEAEAFLNPDARSLHDPLLLSDMAAAVAKIRSAVEAGWPICVYGDYDVDGVCASAILSDWLKRAGAKVQVYLPSRHTEGYGLNAEAIREIAGWARLLVTVDCGVTSVELVSLACSLGMDVVVTDHHRPGEALPGCPVVNPLLNGYPFPALCGAGVAWKLVSALSGGTAMEYVDVAALATVADVVSLTGENRAIVRMGLDSINARPRLGIAALIEVSGLANRRITSTALAFQLAPRLNAGGRIGSAMRSYQLITAASPEQARTLADELEQENVERRRIEAQILEEAEAQLADFDFPAHRILILAGKDWNAGVIGLAASRLVEKYHYPVVMLADQRDHMTGSCRSIEGVDIHAALSACAQTMVRFGGHRQAAGLTLLPEKLDEFRAAMDAYLFENIDPGAYIPTQAYDMDLDFAEVTQGFIASLEALQPTGFGNPAPVFRAAAEVLEARAVGAEGAHLKLMLAQGGRRMNAIAFREGARARNLTGETDVLFTPKINAYMGRTEVQLEVRALADSEVFARIQSKLDEEARLQCDFLTEMFYNKKINPPMQRIECARGEELTAWLGEKPQGTLVLATDLAAAARLYRLLGSIRPDLYIGEMPADPRAFNAVCVCPSADGIPVGYRRVVLAGMPEEYPIDRSCEVFAWETRAAWMKLLPDVEAMRETWRAMARIGCRPVSCRTLPQLVHLICADTGMDARTITAALMAIKDLNLIAMDLSSQPIRIRRSAKQKADPESSAVWRVIQRWRTGDFNGRIEHA